MIESKYVFFHTRRVQLISFFCLVSLHIYSTVGAGTSAHLTAPRTVYSTVQEEKSF
jgi:hypothetical protein